MKRLPAVAPATTLALAAILLWSTFAALAVRLKGAPPLLLTGLALLLGALCGLPRLRADDLRWRAVALGVYGLFTYHLALFLALRLAPPVEANLLNYLWPLLIVLLTPAFFRGRRLTARHVAGALLGFAGAALLLGGGAQVGFAREHLAGRALAGHALAVAAAVIWATYSLATARLGAGGSAAVSVASALSGLLALGAHLAFEPRFAFARADLPWLGLLGLGPMGLAFLAWDAALRRGDPRAIGQLSYLTPLLSTLLLAFGGGGRLTAATGAALALIVGGAALGTWPVGDRKRRAGGAAGS
jgi:drug/metabolite transporter (DMT)-like permease